MTNISKKQLPRDDFQKLFQQMTGLLAKSDQTSVALFLQDLLGEEERIMLVKRFIAIVMLSEGNSSYRIWISLHLSPSTAEKIRLDYERGNYNNLVKLFKKQSQPYKDLWETLEIILRAGLPPRGKGRWKSFLQTLK